MRNIIYILPLIIILAMLLGSASTVSAQQKYALLISAGETTVDDNNYHSEYWYDLFLMYRMLIEDGFTHDNIFVLYGDGNDFASAHADYQPATFFPVGQITDYPNSKADVDSMFSWLADGDAAEGIPQIQEDDFLFYWWMGHGSAIADCDYYALIQNTGEHVLDTEFEAYFARLPDCHLMALYVMTCHSAGLIDNLEGLHRMIHTAAPCDAGTQSFVYDVWHAEFSYHVASAFREQDMLATVIDSDTDENGLVSCHETNAYAHTSTTSSTTQVGDYRNIAPLLLIANAQPGADVPREGVYSRDYAEDNGVEPSDYMSYVWYHGPDLWVRNVQDDEETNQDPEFGSTNYVYSRIHNIDCTAMDVDVELSWSDVTSWSNPASWNTIASFTETGVAEGESRVVNRPWTTVPAPGKYCLHTVLNAAGDAANADGRAFMDNNKVQINVTVVDLTLDWARNIHWNIENGLPEPMNVDLVLERRKHLPGSVIKLHIPPEIRFATVLGGEARRTEDGTIIVVSPGSRTMVIKDMQLKGDAKHLSTMTVRMPKEARPGTKMQIRISERVKGREMGGVVFDLNKVTRSEFMGRFFRDAKVFFSALEERFDIRGAKKMAAIFETAFMRVRSPEGTLSKEALCRFSKLHPWIAKCLARKLKPGDMGRFNSEMKRAGEALRDGDWEAFSNHLESGMIVTRPLFLSKLQR